MFGLDCTYRLWNMGQPGGGHGGLGCCGGFYLMKASWYEIYRDRGWEELEYIPMFWILGSRWRLMEVEE
jgi:hypothetical protein